MMRHTQALQDQLYDEFSGRVGGDDRSPYLQVDNWYYYSRSDVEKEYSVHCRKYDNPDHAMEQVILDENEEAKGEDYYQLGPFEVSPNHNLLAYGTDTEGNERFRYVI
jgi:oligopeptidase B